MYSKEYYEEIFGDWIQVVDTESLAPILKYLQTTSIPYTPFSHLVFRAFWECNYSKLRVVIVGQDPYPQEGVAQGIAFANNPSVNAGLWSPSLQVIENTLQGDDLPFHSFDSMLIDWCKQGILLLNSALTTEVNNIGSHTMLWRPFISKLLDNLAKQKPNVIFVLLGSQAQSFAPYIAKHGCTIVKAPHPAYYVRLGQTYYPDNENPFLKIDNIIKERGEQPIIWAE